MHILGTALSLLLWALAAAVLFTYGVRAVVTGERLPPADPDARGGRLAQAVGAFCRELLVTAGLLAMWPLGLIPTRLFSRPGEGSPILLVPGSAMTWTACIPLSLWLTRQLPNPLCVVSCNPLWAPPERVAAILADRVRTVSMVADDAPVHVIGFGDGGLAMRLAVGRDVTLPVGKLVTIAAPVRPARMGVFLPGGADRHAGLAEAPLARPDLAVRSEGDNVVFADESTPTLAGATMTLATEGHLSAWISPRSWRAAARILADTPDAEVATDA
jgi:hypothetical protein